MLRNIRQLRSDLTCDSILKLNSRCWSINCEKEKEIHMYSKYFIYTCSREIFIYFTVSGTKKMIEKRPRKMKRYIAIFIQSHIALSLNHSQRCLTLRSVFIKKMFLIECVNQTTFVMAKKLSFVLTFFLSHKKNSSRFAWVSAQLSITKRHTEHSTHLLLLKVQRE